METIFANFLPLSWKMSELRSGVVYGQPVAAAMRLVRAVCCAGRHMAATLVSWAKFVTLYWLKDGTDSFLPYMYLTTSTHNPNIIVIITK